MLNFIGLAVALWSLYATYRAFIERANVMALDRGKPATVRVQTIAIWLWHEMWASCAIAIAIMVFIMVREIMHNPRLDIAGWLLVALGIGQRLAFHYYIEYLNDQPKDYWTEKKFPRQVQF